MGFSIRGGLEYGCGMFVSEVLTSSKAAQAGLRVTSSAVAHTQSATMCIHQVMPSMHKQHTSV